MEALVEKTVGCLQIVITSPAYRLNRDLYNAEIYYKTFDLFALLFCRNTFEVLADVFLMRHLISLS